MKKRSRKLLATLTVGALLLMGCSQNPSEQNEVQETEAAEMEQTNQYADLSLTDPELIEIEDHFIYD